MLAIGPLIQLCLPYGRNIVNLNADTAFTNENEPVETNECVILN